MFLYLVAKDREKVPQTGQRLLQQP